MADGPAGSCRREAARYPRWPGSKGRWQGFLDERGIRGATMAVARDGRLILERAYGYSDRNATRPMAPDDPMRLASLSKLFTGAAIHRLMNQGKLRPDTRVAELLDLKPPPGRTLDPRWKNVTIQHLLDHRGGWRLVDGWDPVFATDQVATKLSRKSPASARDLIDFMAGEPLQFDPGTAWAYSNFGYVLLGRVIERVSGHFLRRLSPHGGPRAAGHPRNRGRPQPAEGPQPPGTGVRPPGPEAQPLRTRIE